MAAARGYGTHMQLVLQGLAAVLLGSSLPSAHWVSIMHQSTVQRPWFQGVLNMMSLGKGLHPLIRSLIQPPIKPLIQPLTQPLIQPPIQPPIQPLIQPPILSIVLPTVHPL